MWFFNKDKAIESAVDDIIEQEKPLINLYIEYHFLKHKVDKLEKAVMELQRRQAKRK